MNNNSPIDQRQTKGKTLAMNTIIILVVYKWIFGSEVITSLCTHSDCLFVYSRTLVNCRISKMNEEEEEEEAYWHES